MKRVNTKFMVNTKPNVIFIYYALIIILQLDLKYRTLKYPFLPFVKELRIM